MNKTNLLVDTGIFIAMLVAMEPRFSGVAIHEWLSLALAATIVVHLLLHWKWIVEVGGRFFRKLWHSSRLKFGIDVLLFVDFIAVMLSGILISRVALPALGISLGQVSGTWRQLHSLSADAVILLVGLHFALSWGWVVSTEKRLVVAPVAGLFRPKAPAAHAAPVTVSTHENMGN
jgi:hypothetical protein